MRDYTAKVDDYARFEIALLAFVNMKHRYCKCVQQHAFLDEEEIFVAAP